MLSWCFILYACRTHPVTTCVKLALIKSYAKFDHREPNIVAVSCIQAAALNAG